MMHSLSKLVYTIALLQLELTSPVDATHAATGCGVTEGHQIKSVTCKTSSGTLTTWSGPVLADAGDRQHDPTEPPAGCAHPTQTLGWGHFHFTSAKDDTNTYSADIEGFVSAAAIGDKGLRICTAVIADDTLTDCACNST